MFHLQKAGDDDSGGGGDGAEHDFIADDYYHRNSERDHRALDYNYQLLTVSQQADGVSRPPSADGANGCLVVAFREPACDVFYPSRGVKPIGLDGGYP